MPALPGQFVRLEELIEQASIVVGNLAGQDTFSGHLDSDIAGLRLLISPSDDIVYSTVPGAPVPCVIVYQRAFADEKAVAVSLRTFLHRGDVMSLPAYDTAATLESAVGKLLAGDILLLQEGTPQAVAFSLPAAMPSDEPQVERVIRGPHEAFTSNLHQNLALMRRMAKNPKLRVEIRTVPGNTARHYAIAYMDGKAPLSVRAEVLRRMSQFKYDDVVSVTVLKPFLADDPYSPFVNIQLTERVDTAVLGLENSRVVLLVGNAAEVLLLPATLIEMLNSPEDRYLPRYIGNFARFLRLGSFLVALAGEASYIAVTSVHQELLPTPLAFAVARSRAGVPLPVFAEVIVMALIIEVLREAAIRLPRSLSQTISIVGALVIGQAVVQAGLISAPVIVLVAVVALASFTIPQYEIAVIVRLLRFPAMVAGVTLGLFGVVMYVLFILIHLAKLRSFGVSYLSPAAPLHIKQAQRLMRIPFRWYRKPQPS